MDEHDAESARWLAEMNRRILAGRPVASRQLADLEQAYLCVTDRWGPPSARPTTYRPFALISTLFDSAVLTAAPNCGSSNSGSV